MHLELRGKVIFDEPELHWPLGVFKDTEYHYFEEAFVPTRKFTERNKVVFHIIDN